MFENTLGTNKNCGRWSEIVAFMLPEITSWEITLENILSVNVLEWLVSLVGCRINGKNEFEVRESKKSLVVDDHCSLIN